ncbi:MAG: type pilus assembly PilZ [Candidatus Sulfotelmatobacter sp.]|nr:type pilus assembly PilZ [Candidatus Sulfotelmatobacter sp.]
MDLRGLRGTLMGTSGVGQGRERPVSERLRAATDELQKLEQLVVSGDCSPRVLTEFRGAVDSIRQTAWAVQQWTELQSQHRDPYTVLGILSEERVRRATQLSRDLRIDLESLELSVETEGLDKLFQATKGLYERLAPLFRNSGL